MLRAALALVAFLALGPAWAGTNCTEHFYRGQAPTLAAPPEGAVEVCHTAYANLWDPATRDPVYAAEHLTSESLLAASRTPRKDAFHVEPGVPAGKRVTPRDYEGSGYDKGHMAPDHDMPTPLAVHESFSMANMVPQDSVNNRGTWAQIERVTRALVVSVFKGDGWVVTGPIFAQHPDRIGVGDVAVPKQLFKAVYVPGDPSTDQNPVIGAFLVDNAIVAHTRFVSLSELKQLTGVDAFPALPDALKGKVSAPEVVPK